MRYIFITLPKKPGTTECEHRTIIPMSQITKILLRIIMKRVRNKIKIQIRPELWRFVEGKGINNDIYILRTLIERSIEVKTELYHCCVDYTKAFDKVKHNEVIHMLENLNIDSKDLRISKNMYFQQTATIRVGNKFGLFQQIKQGVRQGCVLSPDMFSSYS